MNYRLWFVCSHNFDLKETSFLHRFAAVSLSSLTAVTFVEVYCRTDFSQENRKPETVTESRVQDDTRASGLEYLLHRLQGTGYTGTALQW